MRTEKHRNPKHRKIAGILAAILAVAILATGTLAVVLPFQHKSNEFDATGGIDPTCIDPDVTLWDEFEPEDAKDWQAGPQNAIDKVVYVENTGSVPVYVKIQLKEYMEIFEKEFDGTLLPMWKVSANPLAPTMVNEAGKPSLFGIIPNSDLWAVVKAGDMAKDGTTPIDATANAANIANVKALFQDMGFEANTVAYFTEAISGQEGWFVVTEKGEKNGQYGRYAWADDGTERVTINKNVIGTKPKAGAPTPNVPNYGLHERNAECNYDVRKWNKSGGIDSVDKAFMSWVSWMLGEDVIYMADWLAGTASVDNGTTTIPAGEAGPYWIIDTDGWIYWGEAIAVGDTTSDFLQKVSLNKQPTGDMYYVIHIDMEACTEPMTDWPGAPINRINVINPAGTQLLANQQVLNDVTGQYVDLGNGFKLRPNQETNEFETGFEVVTFGKYWQTATADNTVDGDRTDLDWYLLDIQDGKAQLITKYGIEALRWNPTSTDGNKYEDSNLRYWLNSKADDATRTKAVNVIGVTSNVAGVSTPTINGNVAGFLSKAFTPTEISDKIVAFTNNSDGNGMAWNLDTLTWSETHAMTTANPVPAGDKVFALSREEVWTYFGGNKGGNDPANYTNSHTSATPYAVATGGWKDASIGNYWSGATGWWSRSSGYLADRTSGVQTGGAVNVAYEIFTTTQCARPALWVDVVGS